MAETSEVSKTLRNTFEFSGGEFYFTVTFVGEDEVTVRKAADRIIASMQRPLKECVEYFHDQAGDALPGDVPCEHTVSSELGDMSVMIRISVRAVTRVEFELVYIVLARICLSIIRAGGECMAEFISPDGMGVDELSPTRSPGIGFLLGLPGNLRGAREAHRATDERNDGQYL